MAKRFQATRLSRIVNGINVTLLRLGIKMGNVTLLEVRGCKSGQLYTTPVMLFRLHGQRWLCSVYGQVNWVRNLRAAGEARLRQGSHTERVCAVELPAREAAPLLKYTLACLPRYLRPYFDVTPDAPLADVEREVLHHPVFLLESAFEQEGAGRTGQEESMAAEASRQNDEAEIKRVIEGGIAALRARDIEGVMSNYAPEVVTFDIVPPLCYRGAGALRKLWEAVLFAYQGPIDYELRDLSITVGDDLAFTYSLNRLSGTMTTGQKNALWLRWTACFRKINGTWLIVHQQNSVPADMETGRAVLDLKP